MRRGRGRLAAVLDYFAAMPPAAVATHQEVLRFVEDRKLWGRGIGWIDAHVLVSAILSRCGLWTLDARLKRIGSEVGLSPA